MSTAKNSHESGSQQDNRSEFDKGFHEGVIAAYRDIQRWSDARLGRLEPGKNLKMRDEIEFAQRALLHNLRHHLPAKLYPEVWQ